MQVSESKFRNNDIVKINDTGEEARVVHSFTIGGSNTRFYYLEIAGERTTYSIRKEEQISSLL